MEGFNAEGNGESGMSCRGKRQLMLLIDEDGLDCRNDDRCVYRDQTPAISARLPIKGLFAAAIDRGRFCECLVSADHFRKRQQANIIIISGITEVHSPSVQRSQRSRADGVDECHVTRGITSRIYWCKSLVL